MIRKLMASSAMLALMTAGSFGLAQAQTQPVQPAQQQPAATDTQQQPAMTQEQQQPAMTQGQQQDPAAVTVTQDANQPSTEITTSQSSLTPDQPTLASAFMGQQVYSNQDPEADNIGSVNDLIVSDDGSITHAVVGVGGFLGIGEKNVAVPFDELQVVERDGELRLIYAATRDQLEQAQAFDTSAYEPRGRARQEQQAVSNNAAGTQVPVDPNATTNQNTVTTVAPAPGVTQVPAGETTANQQNAATTNQPASSEASAQMAAGSQSETVQVEGFTSYNANDQIRASTLMGKEIYGSENESIGEVGDLVMHSDGSTRAAVIDVGGFLGIGEKEVAIPFDQIQMTQDGNEPRLTIAMTREQLEQAPAYERPEMASNQNAGTQADPNMAQNNAATTGVPTNTTDQQQPATNQPAGATAQQTAPATGEQQAAQQQEQFMPATQDISAEMLMGKNVVGSQDETLGEVGDVVFTQRGEIQAVVVDVGGFLGIGEKSVAINFDQLNVQKSTDGDLRLQVNATQEQLENAPEYNVEQATVQ